MSNDEGECLVLRRSSSVLWLFIESESRARRAAFARRTAASAPDDGVTGLRVFAPVVKVHVKDDDEPHLARVGRQAGGFGQPLRLLCDGVFCAQANPPGSLP